MKQFWLLGLILLAFVVRMYRLDAFALRGDESFTVLFVQRTWEGLWRGISTIEPNPPLMYLALRVWIAVAGASEFVTRYFSVFFGVLGVPLLYRLAREMFKSQTIALTAAALIAINPYQIWHSQDVRNYTMWPTLSLLALVFFWQWWRKETTDYRLPTNDYRLATNNYRLILYVVATLASLYTHYYDVFILAALNLFVFTFAGVARRWQTLVRWIGAQVVLVLLYAPWVLVGTNRITTYNEASAEQSVSLLDVFSRTLAAFIISETVPRDVWSIVWIPLALLLVAILAYLAKRNRERALFLALYIVVPTLALYIISLGRPLFLERYLNGIAPAYYLVFAVGIAALIQRRTSLAKVGLIIAALFFIGTSVYATWNANFDPAFAKAPLWREMAQMIIAQSQPGDLVVQNFTEVSPYYYLNPYVPLFTVPKDYWYKAADEQLLRQWTTEYRRIWFIPAQPNQWDPDQQVEKFLAHHAERVFERRMGTLRVQLYLTPREFAAKIIPLNARVGNAILTGYHVERGNPVRVVLYWRAEQPITQAYSVFVHLVDMHNQIVAQQDRAPAFGWYPTTEWQPGESIVDVYELLVDTPGTYALIIGMYDPNTLERVPAFDANGTRFTDDSIVLTQITIP